jgi:DNA-binding MarR family transcriptional regulator
MMARATNIRKHSNRTSLQEAFDGSLSSGTVSGSSCIFSEEAARSKGIEPQQHQLLLAVKGLPRDTRPTITALSHRLCLRHHSTVELVDRLVDRGAARRRHGGQDHREVLIELTPYGEALLHRLSVLHWEELRVSGPALAESLRVVGHPGRKGRGPA